MHLLNLLNHLIEVPKIHKIIKKINKFFLKETLILLDLKMKFNNFNKSYLPYRNKPHLSDKAKYMTLKNKKTIYTKTTK